jgi:hypothetical protein
MAAKRSCDPVEEIEREADGNEEENQTETPTHRFAQDCPPLIEARGGVDQADENDQQGQIDKINIVPKK